MFIKLSHVREQWFPNIRGDVLAGLVVGLCTHPEAIAFHYCRCRSESGLYASSVLLS